MTLLWSIHSPLSIESIHFAALINLGSFLFDLVCIIKNVPSIGKFYYTTETLVLKILIQFIHLQVEFSV